jgi:hypothetical protein
MQGFDNRSLLASIHDDCRRLVSPSEPVNQVVSAGYLSPKDHAGLPYLYWLGCQGFCFN